MLLLLSQAFATWRGWGADSAATLLAGCFLLCSRWQWIVGVALLNFVLVSWCVVCFWAPLLRPPRLLTQQRCGSGCVCRPEFSIIRLKNNSIYLKPDESLVYIGEEFRFHGSSRFRKKAGDAKLRFYHSFVPVLVSLAAESCRSRAESVHLLKPYLQLGKGWKSSNFVTPDDSARNCKMRKMMSLNSSICLMPIFGVGKAYRIWTPKGGPPQCCRRNLQHARPCAWITSHHPGRCYPISWAAALFSPRGSSSSRSRTTSSRNMAV